MKKILLIIMLIAFTLDGYSLQKGGVVSPAVSSGLKNFIFSNL